MCSDHGTREYSFLRQELLASRLQGLQGLQGFGEEGPVLLVMGEQWDRRRVWR